MHRAALMFTLSLLLSTVLLSAPTASADSDYPDSDFGDSDIAVLGDSLAVILDGIHGERKGDYTVRVLKVNVLRTDKAPFEVYSEKAFRKLGPVADASYAVVTNVDCSSEVDQQRYSGQKTNWYMFENDQLVAHDNHIFSWRCVVFDQFSPASISRTETEHALLAWVEKNFPRSGVHIQQLYEKGIAYARYGRVEDAKAMLAEGDAGFDMSPVRSLRREGNRTLKTAGKADRVEARNRLETEISNVMVRIEAGEPHFERPIQSLTRRNLTDADRKELATETERIDRERKEKWEREKDSRLYVEAGGGWILVEGVRLRQGPREGEQFVSYAEMVKIKAERDSIGE